MWLLRDIEAGILRGMSDWGHFQTKSEAASLPVYWSGPPTRADVLHLAFVLNNALRRVVVRSPLAVRERRAPDRTPAAQNITSLFFRPRTFSAGSAT